MRRAISTLFLLSACSVSEIAEGQGSYPLELQVMPVTLSVRRNSFEPNRTPTTQRGTLKGVEGSLLGASSGIGLYGRFLTGNLAGPSKTMLTEGGVLIGDRTFRLEFGYAEQFYVPVDSAIKLLRGGLTYTSYLGTSGVAVRFRGSYFTAIENFKTQQNNHDGWTGETAISYTWDRFPVFTQLGYRIERQRGQGLDEESSALTLGAGIWLWAR